MKPNGGKDPMNRNHYDGELLQCPKCEREFPSFYTECPYCEAAKKSKAINKRGRVETFGLRVGTWLLALALVAGGIYLCASMLSQGIGGFGREYAVNSQDPETVQMAVSEQEVSIAGETSSVPTQEETGSLEDADQDAEDAEGAEGAPESEGAEDAGTEDADEQADEESAA
jgi:hypothetical protein